MGIDGIGKSGAPPPIDAPQAGSRSGDGASGSEFRVERTQAPAASDLERLERNEITRDEYLNNRVEAATAHLQGHLAPARLEEVKEQLRAQLEIDPVLRRLLQRATGVVEGAGPSSGTNQP